MTDLKERSAWLRREIFKMIIAKGDGHIPSCFSCVEILTALYYGIANVYPGEPNHPHRDRIIVSKGHASPAQYPILADLGFFPKSQLEKYAQPGGLLGMYADRRIPGIETISGSLGHGLGIAAGMALAAKAQLLDTQFYVVLGDGECEEGSVYEAAQFIRRHELTNITAIIDDNGLCISGSTDQTGEYAFTGWYQENVDGHSAESIADCINSYDVNDMPHLVIASTQKGQGISFMENQPEWHNRKLTPEQALDAAIELGIA